MNLLPKPKRGVTQFYHTELKQIVWFERQQSSSQYFVKLSENPISIEDYASVNISDLKPINKIGQPIKKVVKPISAQEREQRESLNYFFDKMALTMPFNCMNCNKPLYASTKFFKRCVCAHLLPKSTFKSIACDPDNIVFLGSSLIGICTCHNEWDDKGAEDRAKMKIYDLAIQRFEKLKSFLTDKELIQAYLYLNIKFQ